MINQGNLTQRSLIRKMKKEENKNLRPMLTFSFDDGYDSDYNIVFKLFKEFGIRGTFFVLGDSERLERTDMTSGEQLKEIAQSGQEIGCHGYGHMAYFPEQDNEVIYNDMVKSKKLLENIIERPVLTHAYPYGGGDNNTGRGTLEDALRVQNIAGGLYEAARGVLTHTQSQVPEFMYDAMTFYGDKNIYNVPCRLSDSFTGSSITAIQNMLEMDEPVWLNLAYHRIYPDGASKPSDRMYESDFRNIVEVAANLKEQKLIDIVPFYEGARRIKTGRSYLL